MTIHILNTDSAAVFVPDGELAGVTDIKTAERLAREAFKSAGLDAPEAMELEEFTGAGGVLVFARLAARAVEFADFEDMLAALRCLPEGARGAVWTLGGVFYLLPEGRVPLLSEFGEPRPAAFTPLLREHGTLIFDVKELDKFREKFI